MWARVIAAAGASVAALAVQLPAAQATTYHEVVGTLTADHLRGTGRADLMRALGGHDIVRPGRGTDIVRAGPGNDKIYLVNDGKVDRIYCGGGFDVVAYRSSVDQNDLIDPNCEGVVA